MHSIFTLALAFVFFTASISLSAQSAQIKDFEKSIGGKQGTDFIMDALTLAQMYYAENLNEQSAEWAEKAYEQAEKLNNRSYMALALNRKGKALMSTPSKRNTYKNKAFKSFEESNKLTADETLRLDNLRQLEILANALNKRKDLVEIQRQIAVLKGEELKKEVTDLSQQQQALQQRQEKLEEQQQSLQSLVAKKEAAIQNMSAAQMKQELILSEQERILDSLTFSSILDSMDLAQTEMLVKQQEAELRERESQLQLQKSQRNFFIAVAGLGLLLLAGVFHRYFAIRRHNAELGEKNRIIEEERKRSEALLLNILPVAVAEELKDKGIAQAQHYEEATVLFADFQGFSKISKMLSAEALVAALNEAFTHFDQIIGKYGLEKIKTIGDSYMCAGGLPGKDIGHPVNVIKAALEMQQFLRKWNAERAGEGLPPFNARIGIHTGPLVAGVVGSKKFAYDIWGDTVNVASRMESSGEAGRVNISATTHELVKSHFKCDFRGKVPAKNYGEVDMYFVAEPV